MKKNNVRALVLFSGGLDSRITSLLLQEQGIETELLYFKLPFGCGCCNNLECNFNFSQLNNSKLRIIDCTKGKLFEEYMKIVISPKYGRGSAMNPCIHCRIFMLNEAKKIMKKEKFDFIATGEVLGQRPMSQYKKAMMSIDKEVRLEGKILRPLSAKLLPETIPEKNKLVARDELLAINGRARRIQLEIAKKYNIKFPTPSGGCLLCEKNYSARLTDILNHKKITPEIIETLAAFRHFRLKGKIILGRNEKENKMLEQLNKNLKYNILISPKHKPGPTALFENKEDRQITDKLIEAYSNKNLNERLNFENYRL